MKYFLPQVLILSLLVACQPQIKKRIIQPTNGYAQMIVIEQGSTKTLHISGQIGQGEDLESQMRDILSKLKELLASEGGGYDHLVKINTYIVDYEVEDLNVFRGVRQEVFGDKITPASTLVGVTSLARREWLIEIDAVAIIL